MIASSSEKKKKKTENKTSKSSGTTKENAQIVGQELKSGFKLPKLMFIPKVKMVINYPDDFPRSKVGVKPKSKPFSEPETCCDKQKINRKPKVQPQQEIFPTSVAISEQKQLEGKLAQKFKGLKESHETPRAEMSVLLEDDSPTIIKSESVVTLPILQKSSKRNCTSRRVNKANQKNMHSKLQQVTPPDFQHLSAQFSDENEFQRLDISNCEGSTVVREVSGHGTTTIENEGYAYISPPDKLTKKKNFIWKAKSERYKQVEDFDKKEMQQNHIMEAKICSLDIPPGMSGESPPKSNVYESGDKTDATQTYCDLPYLNE